MAKKDEFGVTADETDSMADVPKGSRVPTHIDPIREYIAPGTDPLTVKPLRRKELGIGETEVLTWVRNPAYYSGEDRVEDNLENRPGSRLITKDGKPFQRQDLVLMAYPEEIFEREEAQRKRNAEDYAAEVDESAALVRLMGDDEGPDFHSLTQQQARAYVQKRHADAERQGLISHESPTAGLTYPQALANKTDAQIQQEEDMYRRQGRRSDFGQAEWDKFMTRRGDRGKEPSKSLSVGKGLGNENPNSALAQAKNRAQRTNNNAAQGGK